VRSGEVGEVVEAAALVAGGGGDASGGEEMAGYLSMVWGAVGDTPPGGSVGG
jgi:hypothetical protein